MWHLSLLFIATCSKWEKQGPGLSLKDCTCGSNRAVVHTVHVPWRRSACLKGMSMGVIMQSMCLGLSFLLLGSSLGADCSNEKDL